MALKKRKVKMSSGEIVFMARRAQKEKLPLTLVAKRGRGRTMPIQFSSISFVSKNVIRGYELNRKEVVGITVKDIRFSSGYFR